MRNMLLSHADYIHLSTRHMVPALAAVMLPLLIQYRAEMGDVQQGSPVT